MFDETERRLAQAIIDAARECQRVREIEGATQEQIDWTDIHWIDAQEAYVEAGYSLEALEA
jgi:hypothetical protein